MSLNKIEQLTLQLDSNWFKSKEKLFVTETFYSKKHNRIFEVFPYKLDIDLLKYCWNGFYRDGLYAHEAEIGSLPVNASDVADTIVSIIDDMTHRLNEDKVRHNVIMAAIETVRNTLEQMGDNKLDEIHIVVLDNFLTGLRKKITKRWRYLKVAVDISDAYSEVLRLDMKLDELAVLVKILDEAGVFHKATTKDIAYLKYIGKHFCFKNQRKRGKYTLASDIGSAVSAVTNNDVSDRVKREIKTKLMKAMQAIK